MMFVSDSYYPIELRVTAAGELAVYLNSTLDSATSGLGLTTGTWYYITFKVVCGASGSYAVYLGANSILSATGVDTAGGGSNIAGGMLYFADATLTPTVDDLYLLDSTGSQNNDVLGDVNVVTLRPSGAGSTQWAPDSGSNYARVNEAQCDDASGYVEDSTNGHLDLYEYDDLTGAEGDILGVMVTTHWWVYAGDTGTLAVACHSSSTDRNDSGDSSSGSGFYAKQVSAWINELDPATSAPWDLTGLNAAQFGVKVQSI